MSKAKRLNEMIMTINRMRRFTVGELAQEFGVSKRTILRDLQELSEMGVPLYSEVGPHGGYQVLRERILPPIAFSEDEAISIFFALHTLRHYISLPFDVEYESIKKKFYLNLAGDIRDTIDAMYDRVDFLLTPEQEKIPFLKQLLSASTGQKVIRLKYESGNKKSTRSIQPIGIYALGGKWYCPSYCFSCEDYRVFRCDRMKSIESDNDTQPLDLSNITLKNRHTLFDYDKNNLDLLVDLTKEGVEKCRSIQWPTMTLNHNEDGSGYITGCTSEQDIPFVSSYFISFGEHALVKEPKLLITHMKKSLEKVINQYN